MKPCCEIEANLSAPQAPNPEKPELTVRECVCGAKHYELEVDPLELGIVGSDA